MEKKIQRLNVRRAFSAWNKHRVDMKAELKEFQETGEMTEEIEDENHEGAFELTETTARL